MVVCLSLGLLALVWTSGCRRRPPGVETAPKSPFVTAPAPRASTPAPVHVNRPHGPAYHVDNGLGSPVA